MLTREKHLLLVAVLLLFALPLQAIDAGPELAAAPSRYASFNGIRVHYKLLGRGRNTLVFVHGLGGEMGVWREQVSYFAPRARLLVVDLPGYGGSDKPDNVKYTMKFFARAVRAAMDDAGVNRAILVGHSMGTPVIRELDRLYPTRVRGLVAVEGALVMNMPPEAVEKVIAPMRGNEYQKNLAAMFDAMMEKASPALREDLRNAATRTPQQVIVSSMEGMYDPAIWKSDRITIPLLVVNAASPFWSAKYVEAVRAMARDLRYVTVDDADHFLMLEKPQALNEAIASWMKAKGW